MSKGATDSRVEILHKQNTDNELFSITYIFETGTWDNPALGEALKYLKLLGTADMSAGQIDRRCYALAGTFDIQAGLRSSHVTIRGLEDNMEETVRIVESLLCDAKGNDTALAEMKKDLKKSRADAKLNQTENLYALNRYTKYGPEYIRATTLSDHSIDTLSSGYLLDIVGKLTAAPHRILYYGPSRLEAVENVMSKLHKTYPTVVRPEHVVHRPLEVSENRVFLADYDANNLYYNQSSNLNAAYDPANDPYVSLYNEYFGAGANAMVFQDLRESRGLAYAAWALLNNGSFRDEPYTFRAFISTQNDKLGDAADAFGTIIEDMPRSERVFDLSREAILTRIRTDRIIKSDVLWDYVDAQDMGVDHDRRRDVYYAVRDMTLDDLTAFQRRWIRGRNYTFGILGRTSEMDMEKLRSIGEVQNFTREDIFGY
jgi:hypothetical protein